MSVVTTVLLSSGFLNQAGVDHVNHHLRLRHQQNPNCPEAEYGYMNLKPLSGNHIPTSRDPYFLGGAVLQFWGGSKSPQAELWAGAYNYLDLEWFVDLVASAPWESRDDVQLFVKGEWNNTFAVYQFVDGAFRRVVEARQD